MSYIDVQIATLDSNSLVPLANLPIAATSLLLIGTGAPSNSLGLNGDYYIDEATGNLYGPKAAGAWGSVVWTIAPVVFTVNTPSVGGGATTVPVTARINNVVVSATTAITMAVTGAADGQLCMVRITDGGTPETLSWVNTENSTVSAPLVSPGSATLPTTVGFQYNGGTSKWRCIGVA
jgi:hypothetical protein